jgi:hypothetical protein
VALAEPIVLHNCRRETVVGNITPSIVAVLPTEIAQQQTGLAALHEATLSPTVRQTPGSRFNVRAAICRATIVLELEIGLAVAQVRVTDPAASAAIVAEGTSGIAPLADSAVVVEVETVSAAVMSHVLAAAGTEKPSAGATEDIAVPVPVRAAAAVRPA